jgi:hypothetical protein
MEYFVKISNRKTHDSFMSNTEMRVSHFDSGLGFTQRFLDLLDCAYTIGIEDSIFGLRPKFSILFFDVKTNFFILLEF